MDSVSANSRQAQVGLSWATLITETPAKVFVGLIIGYRLFVSPSLTILFGIACRHEETCSRFAIRKLESESFFAAAVQIVIRVLSCNPWGR